jgi:bacterioferritin
VAKRDRRARDEAAGFARVRAGGTIAGPVERAVQSRAAMANQANTNSPFVSDIQELRRRARQHIEKGAVTEGYRADRATVLKLLNEALATELVCYLRYKRHYFMAQGPNSKGIADEFLEHATEEQMHADQIAGRITQLGGEPNFSPEGMTSRSHAEYIEGKSLLEMVKEDLVAERIAIESYGEIIRYLGDKDPTSRRLMEEILAKEEEHAEDLLNLIAQMGSTTGPSPSPAGGASPQKAS